MKKGERDDEMKRGNLYPVGGISYLNGMRNFVFTLFCFLLCCTAASGQQRVLDSLLKLVSTAKEDTLAVQLYLEIGNVYHNRDPVRAREFFRKAGELSRKLDYGTGLWKFYSSYSRTFLAEGNHDSMLYYNEQGLKLARKLKDSLSIGIALLNIGLTYREMTNYEKAIEYILEGRVIVEAKGDKPTEVKLNDALQILYNSRLEYSKAITFGEKAVQQSRELKLEGTLCYALLNLSMGYVETGQLGKAEAVIKESLQLAKKLNDVRIEAIGNQNLAAVFSKQANYDGMEAALLRALILYRQVGASDGEAGTLRALALCYLQQKKFAKAREYAEQGLKISRTQNYKMEEASGLRLLSSIYYAMNDVGKGEAYDVESNVILESLIQDITSAQSADLEKKYETQKKESTIKELEAEKQIQQLRLREKNMFNYIFAGSAVILLVVSLLSFRNYQSKQKLQRQRIVELEIEKQLTATEAVLKGEEQERTRLAKDLHDGLGGMLSGIKYSLNTMKGNLIMTPDNARAFERSMDMLDSSIQEMRRVAHNMMPEALVKFGLNTALKDFCNDITKSGAVIVTYQSIGLEDAVIEDTTAIAVYRVVQELIHNTIKHASAQHAIVQVSKQDNHLHIAAEDDGTGFDTTILKATKGIGWTNIQNRVEFLKGKLDVNSSPGKGTSVFIELQV